MFDETRAPHPISVQDIEVLDVEQLRNKLERDNPHGFLNELYELLLKRLPFQFGRNRIKFNFNFLESGGDAVEESITINIDYIQIRIITNDYFTRNPEIFYHFFPEYRIVNGVETAGADEAVLRAEKFEDDIRHATSGLGAVALGVKPIENHPLFSRLTGLVSLLLHDPISKEKIINYLDQKAETILHEFDHIMINRLLELYGATQPKISYRMIDEMKGNQRIKEYAKREYAKKDDLEGNPDLLRQIGKGYIRTWFLEMKNEFAGFAESEQFLKELVKFTYHAGIHEVIVRILRAVRTQKSPEETISLLDKELYMAVNYHLEDLGIILPPRDEVMNMITVNGLKQAFHILLGKISDKEFEKFLERSQLIS